MIVQGLLASFGASASTLLTGLRAYYKFDANSNDTLATYNGTDTNTPTYTAGKISNSLTLVSASSQYVSLPNGVFPWGTNTYTINMWVKLSSTSGNQSFSMTARTSQGLLLYKSGTNIISHAKPNVVDLSYTWTGIDTNWHMWTFVGDGSGMRTYLDGNTTPVATNANTSNITAPSTDTIEVGAYRSGGTIQAGWYLGGQIDEMGVWGKAITTTELTSLYNAGSGRTHPF